MVDILSIASGVVSIVLAIYAIWFAKKESAQSADNYNKTKELLKDIEHKSELIDRGIQFQQQYLLDIINQMLKKAGKESVDMKPLSLDEINEIVSQLHSLSGNWHKLPASDDVPHHKQHLP